MPLNNVLCTGASVSLADVTTPRLFDICFVVVKLHSVMCSGFLIIGDPFNGSPITVTIWNITFSLMNLGNLDGFE